MTETKTRDHDMDEATAIANLEAPLVLTPEQIGSVAAGSVRVGGLPTGVRGYAPAAE